MIKQISWISFLFYLGIGILIYYFFVFAIFYQKELKARFQRPRGQKKAALDEEELDEEEKESMGAALGKSHNYGEDF